MDPDGRGAGDQPVPGRDPGRRPAADLSRRLHGLLPPREDERRAATCAASSAATSSTRSRWSSSCGPKTSMDELMKLMDNAEDVCRGLGIPHRLIQMCTGDLSFTAAAKYDVEMWAPGCEEWLEVSSCSNFMDFQARRANIRYPARAGRQAGVCAHAQRLGAGAAARDDRGDGELSAGRRLDRRARGAAAVHGRVAIG